MMIKCLFCFNGVKLAIMNDNNDDEIHVLKYKTTTTNPWPEYFFLSHAHIYNLQFFFHSISDMVQMKNKTKHQFQCIIGVLGQ